MEEGIESLSYIYSLHIQLCDHLILISHIYLYLCFQVIAIDRSWHKLCFKCGGANTDGCNRTLTLDAYSEHNKEVLSLHWLTKRKQKQKQKQKQKLFCTTNNLIFEPF